MPRVILALDSNGKLINASDLPKRERAALEGRLREHKYGARKKVVHGIEFASTKEANVYLQLFALHQTGAIRRLDRQVKFVLQEPYSINGKRVRAISYIADFVAEWRDGRKEVIEPKGMRTEAYRIKRKLFEKRYPEYGFREV